MQLGQILSKCTHVYDCMHMHAQNRMRMHYYFHKGIHAFVLVCLYCSHFLQTHHTYTMELGSQRVWDYAGGKSPVML